MRVSEAQVRASPCPEASPGPSRALLRPTATLASPLRPLRGWSADGPVALVQAWSVNSPSHPPRPDHDMHTGPRSCCRQTDAQPPEPQRKGARAELRCWVSLTCGAGLHPPWKADP